MSETATVSAAYELVDSAFKRRYRTPLSEYEITETPGYWKSKTPCGGLRGGCREEIHHCLFNDEGIRHTASYFDPTRENGRFASPYRTWQELRAEADIALMLEIHHKTNVEREAEKAAKRALVAALDPQGGEPR